MFDSPLSPDAAAAIAAAHDLAARRGHGATLEEHLLLAVISSAMSAAPGISLPAAVHVHAVLARNGLSSAALIEALEARLASAARVETYRGAAVRRLDIAPLVAHVRRARPFWRTLRRIDVTELFDALLWAPDLAAEVAGARFEMSVLKALASAAKRAQDVRRHKNLLAEHVLLCACDLAAVREPLEAAGVDVDALNVVWSRMLSNGRHRSRGVASVDTILTRECLMANGQGRRHLGLLAYIVTLLRDELVIRALSAEGVAAWDILFALAHRRSDASYARGAALQSARVRVVLHDDPYTSMEHVVTVLTTAFELPREQAGALMLAVHETGSADIGELAADDAEARVQAACELSRAAMMPLCIERVPSG